MTRASALLSADAVRAALVPLICVGLLLAPACAGKRRSGSATLLSGTTVWIDQQGKPKGPDGTERVKSAVKSLEQQLRAEERARERARRRGAAGTPSGAEAGTQPVGTSGTLEQEGAAVVPPETPGGDPPSAATQARSPGHRSASAPGSRAAHSDSIGVSPTALLLILGLGVLAVLIAMLVRRSRTAG